MRLRRASPSGVQFIGDTRVRDALTALYRRRNCHDHVDGLLSQTAKRCAGCITGGEHRGATALFAACSEDKKPASTAPVTSSGLRPPARRHREEKALPRADHLAGPQGELQAAWSERRTRVAACCHPREQGSERLGPLGGGPVSLVRPLEPWRWILPSDGDSSADPPDRHSPSLGTARGSFSVADTSEPARHRADPVVQTLVLVDDQHAASAFGASDTPPAARPAARPR